MNNKKIYIAVVKLHFFNHIWHNIHKQVSLLRVRRYLHRKTTCLLHTVGTFILARLKWSVRVWFPNQIHHLRWSTDIWTAPVNHSIRGRPPENKLIRHQSWTSLVRLHPYEAKAYSGQDIAPSTRLRHRSKGLQSTENIIIIILILIHLIYQVWNLILISCSKSFSIFYL